MLYFFKIFLKFTTLLHFEVWFAGDIGWNVVESLYFSEILQHHALAEGFIAARPIKFLADIILQSKSDKVIQWTLPCSEAEHPNHCVYYTTKQVWQSDSKNPTLRQRRTIQLLRFILTPSSRPNGVSISASSRRNLYNSSQQNRNNPLRALYHKASLAKWFNKRFLAAKLNDMIIAFIIPLCS